MNKQRNTPTSRNVAATASNRKFLGNDSLSSLSESLSVDEPSLLWIGNSRKLALNSKSEKQRFFYFFHKLRWCYRKSLNFIKIKSIFIEFGQNIVLALLQQTCISLKQQHSISFQDLLNVWEWEDLKNSPYKMKACMLRMECEKWQHVLLQCLTLLRV